MMKTTLIDYRILYLISFITILFFACDDYVQFRHPVPTGKSSSYEIPEKYHGIYLNDKPGTERIQICSEGIFKIELNTFIEPLDFYKDSPECREELADFYKPESNDCVQLDFTAFPDSIKTKVFKIDTIFGFGNDYALIEHQDKLFLNYLHQKYSTLKIMELHADGIITIKAVEIDDMINENGLIAKGMGHIQKANGEYQFVLSPSQKELENILKYGYQRTELTLDPLITYN